MVVKEPLSEQMISAGSELVRRLDEAGLETSGALWFYETESNDWRLIIVSPQVGSRGLKAVYKDIQTVVRAIPEGHPAISLKDISAVDTNDPLISLLRNAIRTEGGISRIRFSRNLINGTLIEDSMIYRLT